MRERRAHPPKPRRPCCRGGAGTRHRPPYRTDESGQEGRRRSGIKFILLKKLGDAFIRRTCPARTCARRCAMPLKPPTEAPVALNPSDRPCLATPSPATGLPHDRPRIPPRPVRRPLDAVAGAGACRIGVVVAQRKFQRDRDRVIHSTAFRRLEYKTQVFVNHEGDLFRTRRHAHPGGGADRAVPSRGSAAASNEDSESRRSRLAHDLGAHAVRPCRAGCAERLHESRTAASSTTCRRLLVVDELEERYADFSGLNLTFETPRGHSQALLARSTPRARGAGASASSRRAAAVSLEAQIANLADEIAYNNHDIDDGLRSGLLTLEQLRRSADVGPPPGRGHGRVPGHQWPARHQ